MSFFVLFLLLLYCFLLCYIFLVYYLNSFVDFQMICIFGFLEVVLWIIICILSQSTGGHCWYKFGIIYSSSFASISSISFLLFCAVIVRYITLKYFVNPMIQCYNHCFKKSYLLKKLRKEKKYLSFIFSMYLLFPMFFVSFCEFKLPSAVISFQASFSISCKAGLLARNFLSLFIWQGIIFHFDF